MRDAYGGKAIFYYGGGGQGNHLGGTYAGATRRALGSRYRSNALAQESVAVTVELSAALQPGHISLPNGLGLAYPDQNGNPVLTGAAPNELTASDDRDWFAGTPWHKHVPARVEALSEEASARSGSR